MVGQEGRPCLTGWDGSAATSCGCSLSAGLLLGTVLLTVVGRQAH
jgi:hypothetical protein